MKPNILRKQLRRGDYPGIPDNVRQEVLDIIERMYQLQARLNWLGEKRAATVKANREREARERAANVANGAAFSGSSRYDGHREVM